MTLKIDVHDVVTATERIKRADGPRGQRSVLIDARDDVDRDTGRRTWKQLVFAYVDNRYEEKVVVKATGEVIVDKVERLTEHRAKN